MSDRTYVPDAESTAGLPRAALPDDPALEMRPTRTDGSDDPLPPNSAALFPEVPTSTDDQLIIAIELADRRAPALRLSAEEYDAFLDACSAELVGRLERRGVRMAA